MWLLKILNFQLKKEDLLSRFLQIKDRDSKYVRDIILNYVLAGKDPIATTMTWLIYVLCKHPEVQDKVAKEIKEVVNMKEEITNVADFEACVSEDALEKMQYLHAVLAETIRLYPALPLVYNLVHILMSINTLTLNLNILNYSLV